MRIEMLKPVLTRQSAIFFLALIGSEAAFAFGKLTPYGIAQLEYNSNIFSLSSREEALAQNGDGQRADRIQRYIAGIDASLPLSNQNLKAKVEGRRLDFAHYNRLDHNEYLLSGGADLRFSRSIDGLLNYQQERRMASFEDRKSTALTLETERVGRAGINFDITPEWRLETGLKSRELDSPLADFPDFRLQENTVSSALKYLVKDAVDFGGYAEYVSGRFDGVLDNGKFHQQSVALTAGYSIKNFSRIASQFGYTQRKDLGVSGKLSGLTGELSYHRELTGKTSADVQVFRRVRSYVGGASSVKESGAYLTMGWKATPKTSLTGSYQFTRGQFQESTPQANNLQRRDNTQLARLKLSYQMLPWLAVAPYAGYQVRDSKLDIDSFHTAYGGIELQARLE